MKNIKKLKEVINDFAFLKLIDANLDEYNQLDNYKQSNIVLIGIGGSWLGAELLASIANTQRNIIYLNTVQPEKILTILASLKPQDTLVISQSKSGNTLETRAGYFIFKKWFNDNQVALDKNMIFCSDSGAFFDTEAQKIRALHYKLDKEVGGRFSVLSCMGLVLAKLAGLDIKALIEGAKKYQENIDLIDDITSTIIDKNLTKVVIFNYNYLLETFNPWVLQLIAESLGKNNLEITPLIAIGVRDQHSILQMFSEGIKDKYVLVIPPHIDKDIIIDEFQFSLSDLLKAEYQGTIIDLKSIHPTTILDYDDNVVTYLGQLIIFAELLTANIGVNLGINPFNQNGVENSKLITKKILNLT
jgi:glucose-6-phosphate isomerase